MSVGSPLMVEAHLRNRKSVSISKMAILTKMMLQLTIEEEGAVMIPYWSDSHGGPGLSVNHVLVGFNAKRFYIGNSWL